MKFILGARVVSFIRRRDTKKKATKNKERLIIYNLSAMVHIQTMMTSLTISWFCLSVIAAQSMSQFILNMVSQPNLDPYTKNFLRTSVAQEMFDIEVPPPPPYPQSTPPPEGQFGRPGGEAQMQGMAPTSEAMYNAPPPRGWNGGQSQPPRRENQRPSEAMGVWSESPQQQRSTFGQQSGQVLVNPPYDTGNTQLFRDAYESPQSGYISQRMSPMSNWESYPTRQEMNMSPRSNEFYHPNNNQMEHGSTRNSHFQGNTRGYDLNQEYFPRNEQRQGQGNLPQNPQSYQGSNPSSYTNQGNSPPNYQTQDNIPQNHQSGNAPNYQNQGSNPPNIQNQENVPTNYRGQLTNPESSASVYQKHDYSPRNTQGNSPERYKNYENNPTNNPSSRNIVNSQSNAIPPMLHRNTVSQKQVLATTMAPLPNTMPDNNPMSNVPSGSEAVAGNTRQSMSSNRDAYAQENMPFQDNPARDNPKTYQMGNNNQRFGPVAIPRYSYVPSNRLFPDLNSLPGQFIRNSQTQTGPGFPSQIPLGRNIFGRSYPNSMIPTDYYYRQPSTSSLDAFPFGFEGYIAMQATPPPQLASFAARRMPSPQEMVKSGQVMVPRNVPSPQMMDQMMAMVGFEGVEVI